MIIQTLNYNILHIEYLLASRFFFKIFFGGKGQLMYNHLRYSGRTHTKLVTPDINEKASRCCCWLVIMSQDRHYHEIITGHLFVGPMSFTTHHPHSWEVAPASSLPRGTIMAPATTRRTSQRSRCTDDK